ncbi:hypothetical protein B1H10_02635 [candidate division KSB1 bacterium 4484_188]|nr:MAG: hypothetical protein B1H10_02635 [candidate division KSB1 bacterium 4484_188]
MRVLNLKTAVLFLFFLMSGFSAAPVLAENSVQMLKNADKQIRQVQRDMFAGKTEKAVASLENIENLLRKVQANDPSNPQLKIEESKFKKLVKDLERRTGKDLGGGSVTAAVAGVVTSMPPKPVAKNVSTPAPKRLSHTPRRSGQEKVKMPYGARKPLATANRLLKSLEINLKNLNNPAYSGNKDQLVINMKGKIVEIKESLRKAKSLAAKKGITSHPEFNAIETKIASAEKSISAAESGYGEKKAAAQASAKEVDVDISELKAALDKVQPVFDQATGYVFHYANLKDLEKVIAQIENFEKNDLGTVKEKMQVFAAKYGSTKAEIDRKADAMGYAGSYYRASYPYTSLTEGIEKVNKTRTVMAEELVRRINTELDGISKGPDFVVVERFQNVKNLLKMAGRYKSDNPKVKELQGNIDQRIAQGMKEFHTRVDARNWPGHASNAPSNANALANVALDWFKNSPDWGKRATKVRYPLAIVVTGPWSIQKRNLLGNPIMYGLPIKLAVRVDEDKELNVARVYNLTMRTVEKSGVKMQPPFASITVGDSYYIRPGKVK